MSMNDYTFQMLNDQREREIAQLQERLTEARRASQEQLSKEIKAQLDATERRKRSFSTSGLISFMRVSDITRSLPSACESKECPPPRSVTRRFRSAAQLKMQLTSPRSLG